VQTLLLYALCSAALFYLGSRAMVTSWLWSRYPSKLAQFMDCAACTGFWLGLGLGYVGGYHLGLDLLGLEGDRAATVALAGLCSLTVTPIAAGVMQWGFDKLGHVAIFDALASEAEAGQAPRVNQED
jgi:hypothetical protein